MTNKQMPIINITIDDGEIMDNGKYCCDVFLNDELILDKCDMEEFEIEHSSFRNGIIFALQQLGYVVKIEDMSGNEVKMVNAPTPPNAKYNLELE